MAGPGDLAGDSWLRVSHADRDKVIATLQDAFVAGMLTGDELDARVSRALAARTRGDLAGLTGDLPPVPAGAACFAGSDFEAAGGATGFLLGWCSSTCRISLSASSWVICPRRTMN